MANSSEDQKHADRKLVLGLGQAPELKTARRCASNKDGQAILSGPLCQSDATLGKALGWHSRCLQQWRTGAIFNHNSCSFDGLAGDGSFLSP